MSRRPSIARRLIALLALSALALLATSVAEAQPGTNHRPPDCDLAERRWDSPFSYGGGWMARRYEWHASTAALSTLGSEGLHRTTHLPRWSTAIVVAFAPHIIGRLGGRYRVNWRDWAFDAFTRAAPTILWTTAAHRDWPTRTLALTTFAGGYLAGACYASP